MKYAVIVGAKGSGKSTAGLLVAQKLAPSALVFNGALHKDFVCPQDDNTRKPEFILVDNASQAPQMLKSAFEWCENNQAVLVCIDGAMPAPESCGLDPAERGMTIEIVGLRDTLEGPIFECKGAGESLARDLSAHDIAMILNMFRVNLVSKSLRRSLPAARVGIKSRNPASAQPPAKGAKMERSAYAVVTPASQVIGFLVLLVWLAQTEVGLGDMLLASLCMMGILHIAKDRLYWIGRPSSESEPYDFTIHVALGMCSGAVAGYFATALASVLMASP